MARAFVLLALVMFCGASLLWHQRFLAVRVSSHDDDHKELTRRERELALREKNLHEREERLEEQERLFASQQTESLTQLQMNPSTAYCPTNENNEPCGGFHGRCNESSWSCECNFPFVGKDCGIKLVAPNEALDHIMQKHKMNDDPDGLVFLKEDESGSIFGSLVSVILDMPTVRSKPLVDFLMTKFKGIRVFPVRSSDASSKQSISTLNSLVSKISTPLTLVLGPDTERLEGEANLVMLLSQFLLTDVDVLGFVTTRRKALFPVDLGSIRSTQSTSISAYELSVGCFHLKHHAWLLRHRKPPFGYERHERFVIYCERPSNSFLARTAFLQRMGPFNNTMADLAYLDFFLRIKLRNQRLVESASTNHALAPLVQVPTRLPGYVLVGMCSECILVVDRALLVEQLHTAFAEFHKVELLFDQYGRRSKLVCTKSGGIYGHSNRGLYAPLCHRLQRQRDFLFLSQKWMESAHGAKEMYAISLHHGNLFGALRIHSELFWETDGDIDFVAFNLSHAQLIDRYEKLQAHATANGFTIETTYPEKPWYVSFKKDKTDFQVNARSVLDPLTRGKPPQKHEISIAYQGRNVFMNGFKNPWRGIRADPGHDYRNLYLAQQGWVLHFTKKSVSCLVPHHDACLPDCNRREWKLDHNFCSDAELDAEYRDPILLFDDSWRSLSLDEVWIETASAKDPMIQSLQKVAAGERAKWERSHNWQFR